MSNLPPMQPTGPLDAKIAIIGEAPGAIEAVKGIPFVGKSGQLLWDVLADIDITREEVFCTNVFSRRPPSGDLEAWCAPKAEVNHKLPALKSGKYLRDEFLPDLKRLYDELNQLSANIFILLGGTATWAFDLGSITSIRGTVTQAFGGQKVLATFHPAAVMRNYGLKTVFTVDLIKAKAESEFPEIRLPKRRVLVQPTFSEVMEELDIVESQAKQGGTIAFDIETKLMHITELSLTCDPMRSMCIPLMTGDKSKYTGHYWSREEELAIWKRVHFLLNTYSVVCQNGLYDYQYMSHWGFFIRRLEHDTMLLHHSLYPEQQKGLGFLGSIYTRERSWKQMNKTLEKEK